MTDLESRFYRRMGFDSIDVSDRYQFYLPFFKDAESVVDLGCGTGQFLQFLRKAGKSGVGVDSDPGMVQSARDRGCQVIHEDVFTFLEKPERRFGGAFCSHMVEHLDVEGVRRLLRLMHNVLEPGGTLVLAAPNPKSMYTMLEEFWRDPTHVRPYTEEVLAFLVEVEDYQCIQQGGNPTTLAFPPIQIGDIGVWPIWTTRKPLWRRIVRRLRRYALGEYAETINLMTRSQNDIVHRLNFAFQANEVYVVGRKPAEQEDR